MSKQSLLLVDHDTRSMRVLEVSLRKAGFSVTTAVSVQDALDKLELDAPDLIISETTFPDGDGFELRRRVRATLEWDEIPFIFLTAEAAIENKIRGLELGVDDYLTKPIYIKEIITRINILLQKRQRVRFEERRDGRTRFAGRVTDMPVVDVIQTIEISRKSGVIQFVGDRGRQAAIYFRDGRVIDAEAGALQGEDAVYRLLTWSEGEFEVVFRTVRRREVITMSSQALLMEGMRRLDEWSRLLEQLPALTHRFEVDAGELSMRLGDVPDDNNGILRLIDGKRTLLEVIDGSDVGDLECLQAISRLYFEEMLIDLDHGTPVRRDTGRSMPLVEVASPTPIEDAASGPIDDQITDHDPDIIEEVAPGALMGGYRQSSLMLIDAAVAAAQAIEPSLFDDDEIDRLAGIAKPPSGAGASSDSQRSGATSGLSGLSGLGGLSGGMKYSSGAASAATSPGSGTLRGPPGSPRAPATPSSAASGPAGALPDGASGSTGLSGAGVAGSTSVDAGAGASRAGSTSVGAAGASGSTGLSGAGATGSTSIGAGAGDSTGGSTGSGGGASGSTRIGVGAGASGSTDLSSSAGSRPSAGSTGIGVAAGGSTGTGASAGSSGSTGSMASAGAGGSTGTGAGASGSTGSMGSAGAGSSTGIGASAGAGSSTGSGANAGASGSTGLSGGSGPGAIETGAGAAKTGAHASAMTPGIMMPRTPTPSAGVATTAAVAANSLANPSSVVGSNGTLRVEPTGDFDDDDDSIPETIEADEVSPPRRVTTPLEAPPRPAGREDSGLRMIGSHGRDRAEASGELPPMGSTPNPLTTTQRELVTILPRRITRELQVITADSVAGAPASVGSSSPVPAAKAGEAASSAKDADARGEVRAERRSEARPSTPPVEIPKRATQGTGVRRKSGPSGGALVLLALAAVLAGLAVYMRLRKTKPADHVASDAGMIVTPVAPDAASEPGVIDAGPLEVSDAAVAVTLDAAVARDGGPDRATQIAEDSKQSKVLMDQANDALQEGDFEQALKLANASLKLRRTARSHLVKAQALQRLSRVEEALASIDSAEDLSPRFPMVFELRGRILWAARREDEARIAFEQFLELSPNGATAAQIRRLLDRPR